MLQERKARTYSILTSHDMLKRRARDGRLTLQPLESESLLECCVDRVSGNVSRPSCVLAVACTEITDNIKNSADSAGSNDGGNKVERIPVGVVAAVNRTNKVRACGGLLNLSLEIVNRLLGSSHFGVELIVSTIIDGSDAEGETSRNLHTKCELAVLAIGADGNSGADFSIVLAEGDGDSCLSLVQKVVGGSWGASRPINPETGDVETRGWVSDNWEGTGSGRPLRSSICNKCVDKKGGN